MSHHSVLSNLTSNEKNSKQKTRKQNRYTKITDSSNSSDKQQKNTSFYINTLGKKKKTKIKKKTLIDLLT